MTTLTINTEDKEVLKAVRALLEGFKVSFAEINEASYNPEFIAKIEKSRQDVRDRNTIKVDLDDIWK